MEIDQIYKILSYVFLASSIILGIITIIYAVKVRIWEVITSLSKYGTSVVKEGYRATGYSTVKSTYKETSKLTVLGETVPLTVSETRALSQKMEFQIIFSKMDIHSNELIGHFNVQKERG